MTSPSLLNEILNRDFADVLMNPPHGLSDHHQRNLEIVREAALELLHRPLTTQPLLSSYDAVCDFLRAKIGHCQQENFYILYLDRKNRLIHDEVLSRGTVDHTPVYPREVARQCLLRNASAVILAHNHPSQDPEPSEADISMTHAVRSALHALGIVLHDHIVVAAQRTFSFRSNGVL